MAGRSPQGLGPRAIGLQDWVRTGLRRFRWRLGALAIAMVAAGQDPALQVLSMIPFLLCWPAALVCFFVAIRKPSRRHLLVLAVLGPASATGGLLMGMLLYGARVARAEVAGDRILVALEMFQNTHGHYPDQLAELVPHYLPQPPGPALACVVWDCPFSYGPRGAGYQISFPVGVFMRNTYQGPPGSGQTGWSRED